MPPPELQAQIAGIEEMLHRLQALTARSQGQVQSDHELLATTGTLTPETAPERSPRDINRLNTRGSPGTLFGNVPGLHTGGAKGIRTPDLFHAMEARYQLRHSPVFSSSRSRPVKHSGTPADS